MGVLYYLLGEGLFTLWWNLAEQEINRLLSFSEVLLVGRVS